MEREFESEDVMDIVNELDNNVSSERSRQDYTTWALLDLLKIIKKTSTDKSIHKELDKISKSILKNC